MIITFGKFAGEEVSSLPESYLTWIVYSMDQDSGHKMAIAAEALTELVKRIEKKLSEFSAPSDKPHFQQSRRQHVDIEVLQEIVSAGRKSLSMKHHPDRGGCLEKMQDINTNADYLEAEIRRLR